MTNNIRFISPFVIFIILVFSNFAFTQRDMADFSDMVNDFKIVSSNNSYVEIEFIPKYTGAITFENGAQIFGEAGFPDIKTRIFPVFLPTDQNNRIELIDYKYEDLQNIDVPPVATMIRGKEPFQYDYVLEKNNEAYSINKFYPVESAGIVHLGALRNKYYGEAQISPLQYNPVSRVLRRYSYVRFRIVFGGAPLQSNRQLTALDYNFFKDMAVNWETSLNWSTPQFNSHPGDQIQNSVLSSGDFYKIEINETGMYKLDKNYLQSVGISMNGVNPKTIKIYGNGGRVLPFRNDDPVPIDLIENSIFVAGESNEVFNDEDYILFFGVGTRDITYNETAKLYGHYINPYSNSNYYFLTFNGNYGQRMPLVNSPNLPNINEFTSFTDIVYDEPEINNLGSTGTQWFSQRIGLGESYSANNTIHGYIPGTQVNLSFRFGNGSNTTATFQVSDGINFSNLVTVGGISGFGHFNPRLFNQIYTLNGNISNLQLTLPAQLNTSTVAGYVDWYSINYTRSYSSAVNNVLRFRSPDTTGMFQYRISGFTTPDIKIFDITNHGEVSLINPISYANGTAVFQANHTTGEPKQYFGIGGNNYKTPASVSARLQNQNLRGLSDGGTFIIISPKEFLEAANRLKAHREQPGPNYIRTFVVEVDQIYNEFSGGLLDPLGIRNFLKHCYYNWTNAPQHMLLLGDGSYDFRNLYNLSIPNWLPPLQTDSPTVDEVLSYPSDDFLVEFNENYLHPSPGVPEMATGRLCVNSLAEANGVVDKIIAYESPTTNGPWKKINMYVADDGWTTSQPNGGEGNVHTYQSETIAESKTPRDFEKEKIYIVSYPTVFTPQGRRKPQANEDIINGWNEGRLVINYVGHGSADLWAHEQIFERQSSIPRLINKDKYSFVTIASCDLARYDDPFSVSAGEQLVNLPDKGSIGVIAAVRPVYSSPNAAFNEALWGNFMFLKDTLNLPIRIGKGMFLTKQITNLVNPNTAKFTLLSDPTLRIAIPQYFTSIDSINNFGQADTAEIKALQKVTISGRVLYPDSTFWSSYNGEIFLKVFDVDRDVTIIDFGIPFRFRLDGGVIFSGRANVVNGRWSVEFIVPRDISYNTGNGKIQAYFYNANSDGSGYTNRFVLNGLDENAPVDTIGPEISVYLGDRNFRPGDLVNQNTTLIADFFDESGINLTGTIGHKIEAMLNNDPNSKIDLTPLYNSTINYKHGTLEYPMTNLFDGDYTLSLTAWDTYNNPSTEVINFKVANSSNLVLQNVYNYPNPMKEVTNFLFQHNFDSGIDVTIKIYTVSGRMIKELSQTNITDKFVDIPWDGRDADGDAIANGTYIYRVTIKTRDGSFNNSTTGKLAILK